MFKKILTVFIGSMAAIWISAGIMLLIFIMFIGALFSSDETNDVEEHSILYIDLSGEVAEYQQPMSVRDIVASEGKIPSRLDQMLEAIELAADDPYIDCIVLDCKGSALGYAGRQELMNALLKFRKTSKKKVYAYSDAYSQGDYYVASAADKVVVNPVGMVDIHGVGASIPFFKNALDKIGVTVQVMKVGEFKSAVEPYILTEPSQASRTQNMEYINAIWKSVSGTIATNRGIKAKAVTEWADSLLMTADPVSLVQMNVVDTLQYRREFDNDLRAATQLQQDDDLKLVAPNKYILSEPRTRIVKSDISYDNDATEGYFAVLYAEGDIVDSGDGGIVGDKMVNEIISIANNEQVKGLVLRVNSPGGSAFASEQIWEALEYFKSKNKPFFVSMSDYAASGGYYISCGADTIFADTNTLTGSIGIFGMIPCIHNLLSDKIGINVVQVANTPNANFPSITQPMTELQYNAMQAYVERGYELFTSRVSNGRSLPLERVKEIAEGRVWDGEKAVELGLVDKIGGIDAAIAAMAKKLKMSADNYVSLPDYTMSPLEQWLMESQNISASAYSSDVSLRNDLHQIISLKNSSLQIPGVDPKAIQYNLNLLLNMRSQGFIQARMIPVTLN